MVDNIRRVHALECAHVIRYYNAWIETNSINILMECFQITLQSLLNAKRSLFSYEIALDFHISRSVLTDLLQLVNNLYESGLEFNIESFDCEHLWVMSDMSIKLQPGNPSSNIRKISRNKMICLNVYHQLAKVVQQIFELQIQTYV